MIPTWETEEKEKKQDNRQKWLKIGFTYPLTDPDFEFSQGKTVNKCTRYCKLITNQI